MARPTKYNRDSYLKKIMLLISKDCTEQEIAYFLDISESTLNNWKKRYPEIKECLNDKEKAKSIYDEIKSNRKPKKYNKENAKIYSQNYYNLNKDKFYFNAVKREHRKKRLISDLTNYEWNEILKKFDYSCAYCGSKSKLEKEHIIPVSRNGGFTFKNIIPACEKCNSSKNDKIMISWYKAQHFFSEEKALKIAEHMGCG